MAVSRCDFLKTSAVTMAVAAVADPSLLAMAQEGGGGAAGAATICRIELPLA